MQTDTPFRPQRPAAAVQPPRRVRYRQLYHPAPNPPLPRWLRLIWSWC